MFVFTKVSEYKNITLHCNSIIPVPKKNLPAVYRGEPHLKILSDVAREDARGLPKKPAEKIAGPRRFQWLAAPMLRAVVQNIMSIPLR